MEWLKGKKKLTALILGFISVFLHEYLGVPPEMVEHLLAFLGVYIIGQGVADNGLYRVPQNAPGATVVQMKELPKAS